MSLSGHDGRFALDMQGLSRLKHSARQDPRQGVHEAAQQFEALFLQMMLKSMRDSVPSGGLLDSQTTDVYQSLLDQQWSQVMAQRGIGLADSLVAQLERSGLVPAPERDAEELEALIAGIPRGAPRPLQDALRSDADADDEPTAVEAVARRAGKASPEPPAAPRHFMEALDTAPAGFMGQVAAEPAIRESNDRQARAEAPTAPRARGEAVGRPAGSPPEHVRSFIDKLGAPAQAASRRTGVPAELILAQAALETGWGRHEIATADGRNSHNLFGIKAGSRWQGPTTEVVTHEYLAGRRTRVTDTFRVYGSFEEAFTDYARLIGENPRYARVVEAGDARQAARELQAAGYATDPAYADKLIAVMETLGGLTPRTPESLVFLRY